MQIALTHDIDYATVLGQLREARKNGLTVPVVLMGACVLYSTVNPKADILSGYYNPILAYGEDKAIQDAHEAGANGFIMVDLPPEEAVEFRQKCTRTGFVHHQRSSS